MWLRDRLADLTHGFEVRSQGILKIPPRLFLGFASRGTSGNVR